MDTQFDWLLSFRPSPPSRSSSETAPPPSVSFGPGVETGSVHAALGTSNSMGSGASISHTNSPPHGVLPPAPVLEESVPLSLQAHELTLQESKTYMRWYLDILARTGLRTVSISDVYHFLGNFKIPAATREQINRIFLKILLLINIGEFFALLRVVSHALNGEAPSRTLIKTPTKVPVPPSILLKKRQNDEPDDLRDTDANGADASAFPGAAAGAVPLDIDLFTQFMLTGQRPNERGSNKKLKKLKSVKFSENVVTDVQHTYQPAELPLSSSTTSTSTDLDYLLPMDQLLSRINSSTHQGGPSQGQGNSSLAVPSYDTRISSPDPEEKQILRDMEPQINHFQNLHSVDTILVDGVPSNIHLQPNSGFLLPRNDQGLPQPPLLKPNMTGPAQMARMGFGDVSLASPASSGPYLSPASPLRPNVTGPQDMARFFAPSEADVPKISLQTFTLQMTGNTVNNTQQNAMIGHSEEDLRRPPVPATRRARSVSLPNPLNHTRETGTLSGGHVSDGHVTADPNPGSDRLLFPSTANDHTRRAGPPVPPRSPLGLTLGQGQKLKPPPPPRSRRSTSSPVPAFASSAGEHPPPLPEKVPNAPLYQNTEASSSTANILDDLKALQEEVDKIRDLTGGF